MLRSIAGKVVWVGRTAATALGLALVLALVFGVATTAIGATGGNFILGKANAANKASKLTASIAGPALTLVNNSTGAAATALNISVASGQAPLKVNAEAGTATNLSADRLDGLDSSQFASADSAPLWAVVDGSGNIVHSKGVTASSKTHGPGMYKVVLNRAVHQCAYSAMPVDPSRWEEAGISVTNNNDMYPDPPEEPNALHVSTWGDTFVSSDQQFHLVVYC